MIKENNYTLEDQIRNSVKLNFKEACDKLKEHIKDFRNVIEDIFFNGIAENNENIESEIHEKQESFLKIEKNEISKNIYIDINQKESLMEILTKEISEIENEFKFKRENICKELESKKALFAELFYQNLTDIFLCSKDSIRTNVRFKLINMKCIIEPFENIPHKYFDVFVDFKEIIDFIEYFIIEHLNLFVKKIKYLLAVNYLKNFCETVIVLLDFVQVSSNLNVLIGKIKTGGNENSMAVQCGTIIRDLYNMGDENVDNKEKLNSMINIKDKMGQFHHLTSSETSYKNELNRFLTHECTEIKKKISSTTRINDSYILNINTPEIINNNNEDIEIKLENIFQGIHKSNKFFEILADIFISKLKERINVLKIHKIKETRVEILKVLIFERLFLLKWLERLLKY